MRRGLTLLVLLLAGVLAGPALAASGAVTPHARVRLLADVAAVAPGHPFTLGLRFRLQPGWHIYWRNPGAAGEPPSWKPALPAGSTVGPVIWPAPRLVREGPLATYAYLGQVLLTRRIRPPAAVPPGSAGFTVAVPAHWLICKDICVPEHAALTLRLPWGTPAASPAAGAFAAAAAALPRPSPWAATLGPDGRLWLHGAGLDPATIRAARFFPEHPGVIRDGPAQPLLRARGLVLRLTPARGFTAGKPLRGVLELTDRSGARTALAITARPGPVPAGTPLWLLLGLGVLGGVVLNLMPCVFPVLALKAIALAGAGGRARAEALSYTAGVLVAFAALGGALLVARAGGHGLGWGFQFADPAVVGAMAAVMLAVGLNLSGVFALGGGQAVGQGLAARGGHGGSFFTGLLAVVVASPCTAPFMAAAIGGALLLPAAPALAVFLALGVGLAAPMLVLAVLPGLARALPRPGAWMERLRQLLAFPMYGAAAWLAWVVSTEAGPTGVAALGAALVAVGFAAWALGLAQQGGRVAWALAAVGLLAALGSLRLVRAAPASAPIVGAADAFSPARLAALRAAGRGVLVDVTARWCLTCQVNERLALDRAPVRAALRARRVALLVADWTTQAPPVTAYLAAHGRDGVPLYVFYAPHARQGRILPQVLTPGIVLRAIGGSVNAEHG
jgi:DsbC/DsbD-like thiol-disulfide interchange protein/cytochrome c biogenesis protein CcdA